MTTTTPRRPAPRALRLLGALLPRDLRDPVLGDLLEEHGTRAGFWPHALRTTLALLPRRVLELLRHGTRAPATGLAADLRAAARTLRRAPLFTSAAMLTLAVAIATVVAIYGVAAPVVLRPLPYHEPSRVVLVREQDPDGNPANVGWETWRDLAARARAIERSAVRGGWMPVLAGAGATDAAERVSGLRVSWQYFATLGVRPALGRDFVAADDTFDERNKVILSHGLWARRHAADPAVVGRSIDVEGTPMLVVGVMPAGFEDALAPETQLWRVLGYDATRPYACRTCRHLGMVARVREGVALDDAARDLSAALASIVAEHPRDYASDRTTIVALQEAAAGATRAPLLALLAATGLLLAIAIANVAGLQLARAVRREGEFAVRLALGAGRMRLARQLLGEGVVIAAVAGAVGAALAAVALPLLVRRMPEAVAGLSRARVDGAALLVALVVSACAALLVGIAPLWRLERRAASSGWRAGARTTRGGVRAVRAAIVAGEIAVATVLLAATGLVGRSLVSLLAVDPGFRAENLLTVEYAVRGVRYDSASAIYAHHQRAVESVGALPGVVAAGVASQLPLGGGMDMYGVHAEDARLANPELAPVADRYVVSPGWLAAMGIRVLRGRAFDDADTRETGGEPAAIVSASLARRLWPAGSAVGRRLRIGGPDSPLHTVVGVVGDVRHSGLDDAEPQQVYVPLGRWRFADSDVTLAVRTTGDAAVTAGAVRRALVGLDRTLPVGRVATMEQVIARSTAQRRFALQLLGAFGAVALLLTVAGLYALLAGSVAERTRELGVRSALGATPRALLSLVMRDGARLTMLGLVVGLAGAAAGTRMLRSLLFGVAPGDPVTLASIAALLATVALLACLVPARRAVRVSPTEALRGE